MGHVVKRLPWCVIDIDTDTGQIFVQERWMYNWVAAAGVGAWTLAEKRAFHTGCDRAIWAQWSNRLRLQCAGATPFARRFQRRDLRVNFDIRWVTRDEHWNVRATKIAPGDWRRSEVFWNRREIHLDSNDFDTRVHCTPAPAPVCQSQVPVAHEFGHAIGNTWRLRRGDEYHDGHTHAGDRSSAMNWGVELRARHFRTLTEELDTMIAGTRFFVVAT